MKKSNACSRVDLQIKIRYIRTACFTLVMFFILLAAGCSAASNYSSVNEPIERFSRADKFGQFIAVNKSVDCKGTKVTIEKALMDKTHTFFIAAVDGDIKGRMDYLSVDLSDSQGHGLGRSSFLQKLPDGKTLLTFDAVTIAPKELRMEFFGGPVGYGEGRPVLTLNDVSFKMVDEIHTKSYSIAQTVENSGYRLVVDSIEKGISETGLHYKLTALHEFDGIKHGWLYDWYNNYSPEGEILSMHDGVRKLNIHLSSLNCLGPYYRTSQDGKAMVGRAVFDGEETNSLKIKLTDIYGYYNMNELIPIDGVNERLDINRKVPVKNYIVYLKSFVKADDNKTWVLDYSVLDSAGNEADAVIEADIYLKTDNYRMPLVYFNKFKDLAGGNRSLVFDWQPSQSSGSLVKDPAIKVTKLGIRQEDAVIDINLNNCKIPFENKDETSIIAAINEYFDTFGSALENNDIKVFERKYGYLKPTGSVSDGINDWQRNFKSWSSSGAKEYMFSLNDPIVSISGSTATADLNGYEQIMRNDGKSASEFNTVIYLEKGDGKWKITRVDELTEAEMYGLR